MSSNNEVPVLSSVVNVVLRTYPSTTRVFKEFGIDACCGGAVSIHDAALRDGAEPDELLNALNAAVIGEQPHAGAEVRCTHSAA